MSKRPMLLSLLFTGLVSSSLAQPTAKALNPTHPDEELERLVTELAEQVPNLAVAIVTEDGVVFEQAYGNAKLQDRFAIGSVTKAYTGTILARLAARGTLAVDDAVERYLPQGAVMPHDASGKSPSLRDLATHTAGLTRLPWNIREQRGDPYAGYTCQDLLNGLAETRIAGVSGRTVEYSNLGTGILGFALERAAQKTFAELVRVEASDGTPSLVIVAGDTPPADAAASIPNEGNVPHWNLGCLAPAGAIYATAGELGMFISQHMRAYGNADLALLEQHKPRYIDGASGDGVAMGWFVSPLSDQAEIVWHNGATGGYAAFAGFSPQLGVGLVLMTGSGAAADILTKAGQMSIFERATQVFGLRDRRPVRLLSDVPLDHPPQIDPVSAGRLDELLAKLHDISESELEQWFRSDFVSAVGARSMAAQLRDLAVRISTCGPSQSSPYGLFGLTIEWSCEASKLTLTATFDGRSSQDHLNGFEISESPLQE